MILHGLIDFDDECVVMFATIMGVRNANRGDGYNAEIVTISGESFLTKLTVPQVRAKLLEAEREYTSRGHGMGVMGEGH